MWVRGCLHIKLKHACNNPKLSKTAQAVFDSFGQSHATRMRVLGTVRLVLANQTPPFSLITMHIIGDRLQPASRWS